MPTLYSYQKYSDASISRELLFPENPETRQRLGVELATIDGVTYVSLPDGVKLPADQPKEIVDSIKPVTLTVQEKAGIADASPHVALIRAKVRQEIAEKLSIEDELGLIRSKLRAPAAANAAFEAYDSLAEGARSRAAAEKAKLGL